MFSPDQFLQQLGEINNNLPSGSKVPETPQDDLRSLYKLLKGTARFAKKQIIFDLILPLISMAEYQVFRLIPVPTIHGNHRASIVPESPLLMITLEKDKFYQLNENEYNVCLKMTR